MSNEASEYNELLDIVSDIVNAGHMDQEGLARLRAHLGYKPAALAQQPQGSGEPVAEVIAAAQAVIDRWDSPLWKDVAPTAEYIGRLRAAVEKHKAERIAPAEDHRGAAMSATIPGPWKVTPNGRGFIVYRLSHWNTGWREYLTADGNVSSRASRFKSEESAQGAVDRASKKGT